VLLLLLLLRVRRGDGSGGSGVGRWCDSTLAGHRGEVDVEPLVSGDALL
jgi:hypothetical protein